MKSLQDYKRPYRYYNKYNTYKRSDESSEPE